MEKNFDRKDHPYLLDSCVNDADLHTLLSPLLKKYLIPGLALAIIIDEKITTFECGVKNSLYQDPVTSFTVFEGASLSKPLIAYAALKLCERGYLLIDRPLCEYLTDFKSIVDPRLSVITLRHVLSHTSGFPTANLKKGESLKLAFDPGSQFAYSGESFRYLGQIIEHVTGMTLSTYMQEHVFKLLNMNESRFIWEERYTLQSASPHDRKGQPTEKWKPTRAVASFSLHTTAVDFAKFMLAVSKFPQMLEVQFRLNECIAWSLGWGIETTLNGMAFWHSGDNGTFQSFAFQGKERGVIMLTNSANGFRLCRDILNLVIGGNHPLIDWEGFDSHYKEPINEEFLANWWKSYDCLNEEG